MKIILKAIVTLIILAVFAGTLYFLYEKSKEKPVIYQTRKPFTTNIVSKAVATGSIVPRKEIDIKPQISGVVEKIFVEPGDTLKKNALIARLEIIPDMISLNNAETRLNQARISLKNAELELKRREKLYEKKIVTEAEYTQYETAYDQAVEEVASAESNLQLIKKGTSNQSKETTNTLIRSTINGMVLDIPVEEGDSVIEANTFNAGTTIATVADMQELIFKGEVDESEVGRMKVGMELVLTIGAFPDESFEAGLEYIAPKGKEDNGTVQFEIRAALELKESRFLRAGYSANADIVFEKRIGVMAVKESLLRFEDGRAYVEIETAPQTFEKRWVKLGLSDGIDVEILSGLSPSDRIKVWDRPRRR
ncbi:MAG: efflux RND transporter periplasmic adaptor subunit [Deltaproteobacteria bacterium]|nr:efflux RND transporter periplasmic adaptor subunit [Deltaproteobacteria bacterium]